MNKEKSNKKEMIQTMSQFRSFGGDIPKYIRQTLSDEELEKIKGKDVIIISHHVIEEQ